MPKPLPGRYNINKVTLRNDNTFVDINKGIIREMNFYESIYSPTITGFLVLTETVNLTSSPISDGFSILGNEILEVELELPKYYRQDDLGRWKPGPKNVIRFIGRITDIKEKELIADRAQNYELHFCSEELILDKNLRFSQSYSGKKISDIVLNVLQKLNPLSRYEIHGTKYLNDIIIPYWTPLRAISWLTSRAIPENSMYKPPMLFFQSFYADDVINTENEVLDNVKLSDWTGEVSQKFWFCSLDWLLSYNPRKTLYFGPSNIDDDPGSDPQKILSYMSFNNVINYEVIKSFDSLENNTVGLFNSTLLTHDIITKTWKHNTFNYDGSFSEFQHVEKPPKGPGKLFHGVVDILGNRFTSPPYTKSLYMMSATGTPESPNHLTEISSKKASRLQSLNNFKLNIKCFGDGLLEAGDVVKFEMPSPEKAAESGAKDKFYSGNYLVTSIHHRFYTTEYTIDLECVKETLATEPL